MTTEESRPSRRQRIITTIAKFNLYEYENELSLADQLLSTRLYITFLAIVLLILVFFTGFSIQTRLVTVRSPSVTHFEDLASNYPSTLSCPCSQSSVPYRQFLAFHPQYHQVCSSKFVNQEWISSLFNVITSHYHPLDFRLIASAQFQVLALLCRTADQFVSNAIKQFLSSLLVSKEALFRTAFDVKIAALIEELKANTLMDFYRTDRVLSTMITGSHMISALRTNFYMKSVPNSGKYYSFSSIYSNKKNLSATSIDSQDQCSCENTFDCTFPSGFYNFSEPIQPDEIFWSNSSPILFVPGIQTGCLPRDSLLQSTLECFFDRTCLDTIVAFTGALSTVPSLNATASLSRFNLNTTIGTIFNEMMIESWHNTSNFDDYFRSCAPSMCTYSYFLRLSVVYMMTTLVGLIGGLNVTFRIVAPLILTFVIRRLQSKFCSQNNDNVIIPNDHAVELSVQERMIRLLARVRTKVMTFNLFRKTLIDVQHGIYSTRVYVILLTIGVIILTIYSSVTTHRQSVIIRNPTLEQFEQLTVQYPILSCPCQHLSMSLSSIVTVQPVFHEVCSSVFVENNGWLKYWPLIPIEESEPQIYAFDFRQTGATFFSLLKAYCNVTLQLVANAVNTFNSMQLFSVQPFTRDEFSAQMEAVSLTFFFQLTNTFISYRDFVHTSIRQNQFVVDSSTNAIPISVLVNGTPSFLFIPVDFSYQNPMCSCDSSSSCTRLQGFYCQSPNCHQIDSEANQTIPGLLLSCYAYESFLSSTLECLYNQTCIQMLIDWRLFDYTDNYLPINLTNITALDLNALNEFSTDTTLDDIMTSFFVEDWGSSANYVASYAQCQPVVCTYTFTEQYPLIYIVTSVIGLLGGLIVILHIFVPPSVKIVRLIYHYHHQGRQETQTNVHPRRSLVARARQILLTLNVYEAESNIENQLLATRIYLVLLMISVIIVSLFVGLTQQAHTIIVYLPSESQFNTLYSQYLDTLSCPCTEIALIYATFVKVSSVNHPLCSDSFPSSDTWTFPSYTNETWIDLDLFLLVTQFRLLSSICELVSNAMSDSQLNYVMSRFISPETASRHSFESQINSIIDLFIEETVTNFRKSFAFISDTFRSNQLQNLYMTNWQTTFSTATENYVLRSIPVSYNNDTCTCAVGVSNCSRPLAFKDSNNNIITFPGIVGGCLPIDGLRQSTLECLFDETCVNQLNTLINSSIPLLAANSTRFPPSTTQIGSLVDELFVESWVNSTSYSDYFTQCAPLMCRYSYVERNDIVYILTTLLGLYGGLTIALRLLVWYGLLLLLMLVSHFYHRSGRIDPRSISTTPQT